MINARRSSGWIVLLGSFCCFWGNAPEFSPSTVWAQPMDPDQSPMFGQPYVVRPDDLKKADEAFVRDAIARYGSREAASRAFAAQGWAGIKVGNRYLALENFNRAWLLNPKNYQAFWGFGAVLSAQGKLLEAIEQLESAGELIDNTKETVALLLDIAVASSAYAASLPKDSELERAQYFVRANQYFAESLENDPGYAASWRAWALSLYDQERYAEAAIKAERAQELKAEPFPPNFLRDLRAKISE